MGIFRLFALALAFVLCSNISKAQWVSIPDTVFATAISNNGLSSCMQGNNTIGWQMDTTCLAVMTRKYIQVPYSQVSDLTGIQYFDSLEHLDCSNCKLTWLPPLPPLLKYLDVSTQFAVNSPISITSLPDLPATLTELYCFRNRITNMPALPPGLQKLHCYNNQITSLPALPTTLTSLLVSDNLLTSMPALSVGLKTLDCSRNPIGNLPALPSTLQLLFCQGSSLTALPALPQNLGFLICANNSITVLPALPDSLTKLYCSYNLLTGVPGLPAGLRELYCDSNAVTALPALPATLTHLSFSYTGITQLPTLPNNLREVSGYHSPLAALPNLPGTVTIMQVNHCNLSSLPELPDSLYIFNIYNNPIACLPQLKTVVYFGFDSTNITCLPNYPLQNASSWPQLAGVPVCSEFNTNNCPVFWNITGKPYHDVNGNCLTDTAEVNVAGITVQLWNNGTLAEQNISTTSGFYSFDTHAYSTYQVTIDSANLPFRIKCPASGSYTSVISAADSLDNNLDFALECKPGFDLEARSVYGNVFRPANNTYVHVNAGDASSFYNAHCAAGTAGNIILSFTGPVSYVGPANGALAPTGVTNNTLTWSVADFGSVNFFTDFNIIMQTDTLAQIGQQVCFTLTASPVIGDNNPANNELSICFPIVNSYDPNDKQAYPAGDIALTQKELTYTVRFQNTGNAEAQHIYITDTLDSEVEPAGFQLLAYSHAPAVQIDGNKVRFNFPNINLPDSNTNEPGSHGYVQYKVKLKDNLPVGTVINNTAFIYFDFNAPVVTNTTTSTVTLEAGIPALAPSVRVEVYPNPAGAAVTITVSDDMPGATIVITDMLGRKALVPVTLNNTRTTNINTQQLPEGVYLVNVGSKNGVSVTKRLVVSR